MSGKGILLNSPVSINELIRPELRASQGGQHEIPVHFGRMNRGFRGIRRLIHGLTGLFDHWGPRAAVRLAPGGLEEFIPLVGFDFFDQGTDRLFLAFMSNQGRVSSLNHDAIFQPKGGN